MLGQQIGCFSAEFPDRLAPFFFRKREKDWRMGNSEFGPSTAPQKSKIKYQKIAEFDGNPGNRKGQFSRNRTDRASAFTVVIK